MAGRRNPRNRIGLNLRIACFIPIALFAAASASAAQSLEEAVATVRTASDALGAEDWTGLAELTDPGSAERFRAQEICNLRIAEATVVPETFERFRNSLGGLAELAGAQAMPGDPEYLRIRYGVESIEEVEALSPQEVVARAMEAETRNRQAALQQIGSLLAGGAAPPGAASADAEALLTREMTRPPELLGGFVEDEAAYVVIRQARAGGLRAIELRAVDGAWKIVPGGALLPITAPLVPSDCRIAR